MMIALLGALLGFIDELLRQVKRCIADHLLHPHAAREVIPTPGRRVIMKYDQIYTIEYQPQTKHIDQNAAPPYKLCVFVKITTQKSACAPQYTAIGFVICSSSARQVISDTPARRFLWLEESFVQRSVRLQPSHFLI